MPIRIEDPFRDPTLRLNEDVNPFLKQIREGLADGSLPVLYGPRLKPIKGKWKGEFERTMDAAPKDLILEIGSHMGEVLKNMALAHKNTAFVGMDITFKRVVSLAEKAKSGGIQNVRSLLCNAKALDLIFDENELDGLVIFFPDPWARKKRQQKNRLLNKEFLAQAKKVIKPGGFFWFKTDHKPYFDEVFPEAEAIFSRDIEPQGLPGEIYTSRFERHFSEQGLPKYEVCWRV